MARTLTQPGPERTNRLIFIGAVALAAVAAVLIFVALRAATGGKSSSRSSAGATMSVITASRDIKAGTKITDDMLAVTTVPKSAAIGSVLTDKSSVVGLTTLYPLAKGEQLSSSKVVGAAASKDKVVFSYTIPQGKRALSVTVNQTTSVNGLVVAGDHVDVIVVGKQRQPNGALGGQELPASVTLLQDVEVLAVDESAQRPISRVDRNGNPIRSDTADGSLATRPDKTVAQPDAKTVTLAVTPEQAQALAVGTDSYHVYLSLRPPGDDSKPVEPNNIVTLPVPLQ